MCPILKKISCFHASHCLSPHTQHYYWLNKENDSQNDDLPFNPFCFACICYFCSYHQKYYLQTHKDLTATLDLDAKLLLTSHVAARLNGYLVGVGGVEQFLHEAQHMGLSESQREYVHHYVEKNEGGSLFCWTYYIITACFRGATNIQSSAF